MLIAKLASENVTIVAGITFIGSADVMLSWRLFHENVWQKSML